MTSKKIMIIAGVCIVLAGLVGYALYMNSKTSVVLDPTPQNVTLSGTYVCLPHLDSGKGETLECVFGLKTDDGVYYMVNFGESANGMELFQSGAHIKAEGFTVIKEALSTTMWDAYNMKGIFTITRMIEPAPVVSGKIDINAVCDGALAYMSFPDGAAAEKFVAECKEGKHPEVIEKFKADMGLGDGAAI